MEAHQWFVFRRIFFCVGQAFDGFRYQCKLLIIAFFKGIDFCSEALIIVHNSTQLCEGTHDVQNYFFTANPVDCRNDAVCFDYSIHT